MCNIINNYIIYKKQQNKSIFYLNINIIQLKNNIIYIYYLSFYGIFIINYLFKLVYLNKTFITY